jgi:hypothetical protein
MGSSAFRVIDNNVVATDALEKPAFLFPVKFRLSLVDFYRLAALLG